MDSTSVRTLSSLLCILVLIVLLPSRVSGLGHTHIAREPLPDLVPNGVVHDISQLSHTENRSGLVVSGKDLSKLDLRTHPDLVTRLTFSDTTLWPTESALPPGWDRQRVMELGRSPGLGVHSLHERGITGRGVGIGIIDGPLLVSHREYQDRLRHYEEIGIRPYHAAVMHSCGVTSIAAGAEIGVAPQADVYFVAVNFGRRDESGNHVGYVDIAEAIRRLVTINERLPRRRKIRTISISRGWNAGETGTYELLNAIAEADEAGIFVVTTAVEVTHGFPIHGLGRNPLANPESIRSYGIADSWKQWVESGEWHPARMLFPMESRTIASETGADDYTFTRYAHTSWVVPYIAGLYALAAQVDASITPGVFISALRETGVPLVHGIDGDSDELGSVVDPIRAMDLIADRKLRR